MKALVVLAGAAAVALYVVWRKREPGASPTDVGAFVRWARPTLVYYDASGVECAKGSPGCGDIGWRSDEGPSV
jgi:hypothetical protein